MSLHNIKIIVIDGGRAESYRAKTASTEGEKIQDTSKNKNSPLYRLLNAKKNIENKAKGRMTPTGNMALNMGIQITKQLVKQTANYFISDIGRKNGDSNYQSIVNRQVEIASDFLGTIGNAISGAATGSMFGPAGTVIGLVAGFTSSIVSIGFRQANREREYQHIIFEQNTNQAHNLSRANYSIYTGRVR